MLLIISEYVYINQVWILPITLKKAHCKMQVPIYSLSEASELNSMLQQMWFAYFFPLVSKAPSDITDFVFFVCYFSDCLNSALCDVHLFGPCSRRKLLLSKPHKIEILYLRNHCDKKDDECSQHIVRSDESIINLFGLRDLTCLLWKWLLRSVRHRGATVLMSSA